MVELGFDPRSNVGLLFGDMRSEYVKRGGTEADFVAEVNSG